MATTPINAIERYKKYMNTHNTREVEEVVKDALIQYAQSEKGEWGMCLDFAKMTILKAINHHLQKAREEERDAFCVILKKLYEAGDSRKEMTMEYWQRIKGESELDQDKKHYKILGHHCPYWNDDYAKCKKHD